MKGRKTNMKKNINNKIISRKSANRGKAICTLAVTAALLLCSTATAFAADDPLAVISNLSDFSAPVSGR